MKRKLTWCVLTAVMAVLLVLSAPAAWGQTTVVKGYVHDVNGEPVTGATVLLVNRENGRKYELKTNNKGEYYSLGVTSGRYDLTVLKNGQQIWKLSGITVSFSEPENTYNIDLKKEQAAQQATIPPEVKKQQEEQQKEASKIKSLNEKLGAAAAAEQAGNFDLAIQTMKEAVALDPTRDVLWFKLADSERQSAVKITAPADRTARFQEATENYKKAIAIKPTGAYYNNLGEVQAKMGDTGAAVASYAQAGQLDPANAGQYYFNEGAVLTNIGKVDEAIQAFDKAILADPNRADAYYWKSINLMQHPTMKGNKAEYPPGTVEGFQKYLQLQPTGQFAEGAKALIAQMGQEVETSYGKQKGTKTKK